MNLLIFTYYLLRNVWSKRNNNTFLETLVLIRTVSSKSSIIDRLQAETRSRDTYCEGTPRRVAITRWPEVFLLNRTWKKYTTFVCSKTFASRTSCTRCSRSSQTSTVPSPFFSFFFLQAFLFQSIVLCLP